VQEDATAAQIALLQSDFPSSVSGTSFTMGDVTFNLAADWSDNWFYYKGYFYYIGESDDNVDGVLNVSETTPPLLASVSVNKEKYNEDYVDMGAQLKVVVLADAIQTVGNTVGSDGGALKRWGVSRLVSNDKKRPKASDDVVSTAAAEAANTTASRAAVTSGDYVVTKYQLARIQNMVASVTVSTVYDVDDIYENDESEEEEEVSEVDSVEEETEEIEEIEED
jgi:hypothetical protein